MNEQSKNEKKESLDLKKQENLIKAKKPLDKNTQKKVKNSQDLLIDELKSKLKDAEDKLLRSLADNDNLRKRHDKEIEDNSKYAIKNGFKYLLVLDSDMQHDPSKIKDFLLKRNKYIFIYGKRNFLKNMPFFRILSNFITSLIISLIVFDTTTL